MVKMGAQGPHLDHLLRGRKMVEMDKMAAVVGAWKEPPTSWGYRGFRAVPISTPP